MVLTMALGLSVQTMAQQNIIGTVEQNLTLRVGAGTEWRRLTVMPAGTTVALDGRESSGTWVRGITQNGEIGWMLAQYVDVTPEAIFSLPVIAREAPITVGAPGAGAVPLSTTVDNSSSGTVTVSGGVQATSNSNMNMRSGPSTEYRRVGSLRAGTTLTIDGRNPSGTWVRGINQSGTVGWVSATFLNMSFDSVIALGIVDVGSPFSLATTTTDASTPASAPAAVNIQPITSTTPVTGFSYGGHVRGFGNSVGYMQRAGMTWAKKQVRYNQGDNPGNVAGLINDAHANGFRILLGVVGDPSQVNNGGYFEAYAGFVGGLAALGADAIEIWNEPNLDREWPGGSVDPVLYTQLLAQSYNAIKGSNSNTMVISGAPAPTGFFGGCGPFGCDDLPFIQGMAAAGAANYMDCVGVHYNEGIVPPTWNSGDPRSEYYTRYYQGMVSTYYNAFGRSKPICFTELGYLTSEGYGGLPPGFQWASNVTLADQASWLGQVRRLAQSSGIVRLLIIWNVDIMEYGADPMGGFAIVRPDGSCPACDALR